MCRVERQISGYDRKCEKIMDVLKTAWFKSIVFILFVSLTVYYHVVNNMDRYKAFLLLKNM